jgi:hypothetical protein
MNYTQMIQGGIALVVDQYQKKSPEKQILFIEEILNVLRFHISETK